MNNDSNKCGILSLLAWSEARLWLRPIWCLCGNDRDNDSDSNDDDNGLDLCTEMFMSQSMDIKKLSKFYVRRQLTFLQQKDLKKSHSDTSAKQMPSCSLEQVSKNIVILKLKYQSRARAIAT